MVYPLAKANVRMQPLFVDVNKERKKIALWALWALTCCEGGDLPSLFWSYNMATDCT